jgi:hypothetical protein
VSLLPLTSYRRLTPTWLKWLLLTVGGLVITRYVALALLTQHDAPLGWMSLRSSWLATSVGFTLPSVFAVDQLLRHPAMTPQRLLRGFSPFLAIYALVMVFAPVTLAPDPVIGWTLQLAMPWQVLLSLTQTIFVLGFVAAGVLFIRKVPTPAIRRALGLLIGAHLLLGLDGLIVAWGGWYFRPLLFTEMLASLALWHAYETAWHLQQSSVSLTG